MLIVLAILQAIMAIGALPVINQHIRAKEVGAAWGAFIAGLTFIATSYVLAAQAMSDQF
jgi:Tfp pilus assembly protein FimT